MAANRAALALFVLRNSDFKLVNKYVEVNCFGNFDNGYLLWFETHENISLAKIILEYKKIFFQDFSGFINNSDFSTNCGKSLMKPMAMEDQLSSTKSAHGTKQRRVQKRQDEKIPSRFVWAKLPGCKAKWPVKFIDRKEDYFIVYIRCDNMYRDIKPADTIPFYEHLSKLKEEGLVALKKMPETLKCFKLDVQWALEEHEMDSGEDSDIAQKDGRNMNGIGDMSENEIDSKKVVESEEGSDIAQQKERNMNGVDDMSENEMDSQKVVESEGPSDITQEDERNMNGIGDRSENEMDSQKEVESGRSDITQEDEKNMNEIGDMSENEMDSNKVVDSEGQSDITQKNETNINGVGDMSENEMDSKKVVESEGGSDITQEKERKTNGIGDKSDNEMDSKKVVESEGGSDITQEDERNMKGVGDKSDNEMDSKKVVENEGQSDITQENERNLNWIGDMLENEMDSKKVVESEEGSDITQEDERNMNGVDDMSENEMDSKKVVEGEGGSGITQEDERIMNWIGDMLENEMDLKKVVEGEGWSDITQNERKTNGIGDTSENDMNSKKVIESEGGSDISQEDERNINWVDDMSDNEMDSKKVVESEGGSDNTQEDERIMNWIGDMLENEMDSKKVVESDGWSDITQKDERNMNGVDDMSENEMDSQKVVESKGWSDITQKDERNMNGVDDMSENEIDSKKVGQGEGWSDLAQEDERNTSRIGDRSENEIDSDKVVESEGQSDIIQEDERNLNGIGDISENEMDSDKVVESEGILGFIQADERNTNEIGYISENEKDSDKVVESEEGSDITQEKKRNIDRIGDKSENENNSDKVVEITREDERNMKGIGDIKENENDLDKVVVSEEESGIKQDKKRNMNRIGDKSENEIDSYNVVVSDEESDIVEESETDEERNSIIKFSLIKKNVLGKKKAHLKESEIDRDINYPGIYIRKILKSFRSSKAQQARKVVGNDRVYNSYHACFFCGELKSHVKTHIDTHKKDPEAAEYIGESGKIEQSVKANLLKEGDHRHNCKVIKHELGEIILARRPTRLLDVSKFGPCPECYEWILLKNLRVHHIKCIEKSKKPRVSKRRLIIQSQVLGGFISNKPSKLMIEEVFPSITRDEIGSVAKSDPLIIALGEKWLRKSIDNREKRKNYTSAHMRLMARLLIELRKLDKAPDAGTKELSLYLRSANFDLLLHAAIACCTPYMDDIEDLKSPSNGIKLKYDVDRIISLRWAMLVKDDPHSILAKEMDVLQRLLSLDWADRITKLSRSVLVRRQISLTKHLPSPQDVEVLTKHMMKQLREIKLSTCKFFRIVQLTETRLLMYNKRRSGEIEALSVASYAGRTTGLDDMDESLMDDLTKVEKHLLKTQDLMKVRGKGTRPVAVIIPGDTKKALAFISKSNVRGDVGIPSSNKYLFPNSAGSYTRAYDSLKRTSEECNLRNPSSITSVSMRKYTATLTQLLNLPKHEVEWLCKHLGHSADIHKTFYQQMSGLVERVYVSKLFLVQDLNLSSRYKHKSLKDVDLEEIVFSEQEENNVEQEESEDILLATCIEESEPPADPCVFQDSGSSGEEDNRVNDDEDIEICTSTSVGRKIKNHFKRTRWSQKEEDEIKKYFGEYLEAKICPRRKDVDRVKNLSKKKGGDIWKRSNDKIIKKISNMNHK